MPVKTVQNVTNMLNNFHKVLIISLAMSIVGISMTYAQKVKQAEIKAVYKFMVDSFIIKEANNRIPVFKNETSKIEFGCTEPLKKQIAWLKIVDSAELNIIIYNWQNRTSSPLKPFIGNYDKISFVDTFPKTKDRMEMINWRKEKGECFMYFIYTRFLCQQQILYHGLRCRK